MSTRSGVGVEPQGRTERYGREPGSVGKYEEVGGGS